MKSVGNQDRSLSADAVLPSNPALTIDKAFVNVTGGDGDALADAVGDILHYTVTVTNTGNVTLTGVTVVDPLTGQNISGVTLAPGANQVFNSSYTLTQADLDGAGNAGSDHDIDNTATANSNETGSSSDSAEVPLVYTPALTIDKAFVNVTGGDGDALADAVGDILHYTVTVTNTGNVTLTGVTVVDPLTGQNISGVTLAPGANQVFNSSYTLTQADLDGAGNAGSDHDIDNTATANSNETGSSSDSAEVPLVYTPALTIDKAFVNVTGGDGDALADAVGDILHYTVTVTNTGNVTLTGVTVVDPLTGQNISGVTLAPGANQVFNSSYTLTQDDLDGAGNAGSDHDIDNTATANSNETGSSSDSAEVPLVFNPDLSVTKTADRDFVTTPNDNINYTIVVTNDGNVSLTNVVPTNSLITLSSPVESGVANGVLDVGETWTYTGTYDVTQADINAGGTIDNTVSVNSDQTDPTDPDGDDIASDTVQVLAPPVVIAGSPQFNFPNDVSKIQPKLQGGEFTLNPGGYVYWDFYTSDTSKAAIGLNSGVSGYGFDIDIVTVWSSGTQAAYRVYVANETSNPISLAENTDIVNYSISGTDKGFLDLVNADPIIGNFNNFNNIENAVTKAIDGFDTPPITPTINADKIWSSSNLTGQPPNNFGESPPNPGIDSLAGNDLFYGVNNSATNAFGATSGTETMQGNTGNDLIDGRSGDDNISGGDGDDYLFGGTGNDILNGGIGNDTLIGSYGSNQVTGGTGNDVFVLQIGGIDVVQDFATGVDKLWISTFNGGSNPTAAQFHDGSLATAAAGTKVIYEQTTGSVYFDPDGLSTAGVKDADTFLVAILGIQAHPDISITDILI